ncbi:hypothetical protein IMCC1989_801 [gamma proteobacterium IMCC1989]|nr:hypothetical protein IMCC1989_801 [gamma proteobacterium IMCC1989]
MSNADGNGRGGKGVETQRSRIGRSIQQARENRSSARGLSVGGRPSPRDMSNGYGPSHADVRQSKAIFQKTGSSFKAAYPLYGGRLSIPPRRRPHKLTPIQIEGDTPTPPAPPNTPSSPRSLTPASSRASTPGFPPQRPNSAASTSSTTSDSSYGTAISLSDIGVSLGDFGGTNTPSRPGSRHSPLPSIPSNTSSPSPPPSRQQRRTSTPSTNGMHLAEAEPSESYQRSWSPIPTTAEQAQKAIDLKGRGAFMRYFRPGSPETQKRAAMLEAIEQADRHMIGGMGEHDDSAARAETVAKVGGAVGGVATAALAFSPAAAAAPLVAGGTALLTTGARSKAAYEAFQSQKAVDHVRQYVVGDSHLDARSEVRGAQFRENTGKAIGGVVTAATDAFAPGALSTAVSAVNKAVGKKLGGSTEDARIDEAQAVLATSGYTRPRTPPADGDFHSIAPTPPPSPPQGGSNSSPRSRRTGRW